jgi:hypothetical protein
VAVAGLGLLAPAAQAAITVSRGTFHTLAAGSAMGLDIRGSAVLIRSDDGTTRAFVQLLGLQSGVTYAAHVHNMPCSGPNPGGAHYKNDPTGPSAPPNELWLSSTANPTAGIRAVRGGVASGRGEAPWVARPDAQSIVIHAIPPGGTTAGGPKIACADLT